MARMTDVINVKRGVCSVCHLPVAALWFSEGIHSQMVGLTNEIMSSQWFLD